MRPVCLVIGAGAGIGGTVGKRFAQEGYHSVLCRRSDEAGLNKLVSQINERGGEASGFLLNAVDEGSIEECIAEVESQIGPIEVVVFNLGAQIGNRSLQDTSYKVFELGWKMATFALFRTASTLFPLMEKRGYLPPPTSATPVSLDTRIGSSSILGSCVVESLSLASEFGTIRIEKP